MFSVPFLPTGNTTPVQGSTMGSRTHNLKDTEESSRIKRRRSRSSSTWVSEHGFLGILTILSALIVQLSSAAESIDNLQGEAGFRMVSLKWKYPPFGPSQRSPISFQVKFCELHSWGLNRCRYQLVDEVQARSGRQETNGGKSHGGAGAYLTDVGGLRMATNYTFQVIPLNPGTLGSKPTRIALQTKGFSAKATNCLADSSEVIVETGPYFGGRISVEDSNLPGCFIKGNSQSPQTKYTLRIRHSDCGSKVNGSKVTSVIIVQENVPILTHSTRRFVVVCSFSPESFVVKAGVNLPRETNVVAKSLDFSKLVRISPQTSNLLNTDADPSSSNQQPEFISANNFEDAPLRPISQYHSLTQDAGSSRALSDSLYKGTFETFLVFGMICVAIIASACSVVWFVKSYRRLSPEVAGDTQRIRRRHRGDIESLGGSSNFSYDDTYSSSSNSNNNSLDTRSDFEVELDFEFSEDVNRPQEDVGGIAAATNSSSTAAVTKSSSYTPHQLQQQKPIASKYHSFA